MSAGVGLLDLPHAVIVSGRDPIMSKRPNVIRAIGYDSRIFCTIRALAGANAGVIVRQLGPDRQTGASKDAPVFFLIMVGGRFV